MASPTRTRSSTSLSEDQEELAVLQQVHATLPEEELQRWKDTFALFDFNSLGLIKTSDLGSLMRALSLNLTERAISDLLNSTDHDGSGMMDFPTFYNLVMASRSFLKPVPNEHDVLALFEPFDVYRQGKLRVGELVHILRDIGEPLTQDDVDHLVIEMEVDGDGMVNLQQFVQQMFETSAL